MKRRIFPVLLIVVFTLNCCEEDPADERIEKMSQQRGYDDWFLDSFRCGLFVPHSYDERNKYPLIIYLHGYSDTTTRDLEWYNEPGVSQDPCIVLTPKCPVEEIYGWGDSWVPRVSPMIQKTFEMFDLA